MSVTRIATLVLAALVLAGCGSDSKNEAGSSTPGTTTSDCQPLADAAMTPRLSPAIQNRETMFLTDVSLDTGSCTEKVTFTFKEQAPGPGFDVSYQPESKAKIEDGSGNPIAIAGSAYLVVKLTPVMTAEIEGDQVTPTYTGPRRLVPGADSIVRDVVKTGDFESIVTWAIGVDHKRPFTTDASESQLVVEIDRS